MSAVRLPLLYAFAGGCLTNAVLFGLWRAAESAGAPPESRQHQPRDVAELVVPARRTSSAEPVRELVATNELEAAHGAVTEPAVAPVAPVAADSDSAAPAGSAVSDVLARLETAYRERVVSRAPPEPPPTAPPLAAPEPAPVAAVPPAPAVSQAVLAPLAAAPAAVAPPVAALPVAVQPSVAEAPAFAPPEAAPATQIHYGDVNQNTYITNVRQGDVYLIQMQQLAMLQYMQLLGMSSGAATPARHVGAAGHQRSTPFPSGITNPDNPWGFHFAPPNLVR